MTGYFNPETYISDHLATGAGQGDTLYKRVCISSIRGQPATEFLGLTPVPSSLNRVEFGASLIRVGMFSLRFSRIGEVPRESIL